MSCFGVPSSKTFMKIERPNAISGTLYISTSLIVAIFSFLEYSPETTMKLCMSRRHLENWGRNSAGLRNRIFDVTENPVFLSSGQVHMGSNSHAQFP